MDVKKWPLRSNIYRMLKRYCHTGRIMGLTFGLRLIKGAPFSTLESVLYLLELGVGPTEPLLKEAAELIFSTWQADGRFKLYPQGSVYPCHTANAVNVLCHMGYAADSRLRKTFRHLLDIQQVDGGWRCNKFSFGRGRKQRIQILTQLLLPLTLFGSATTLIMNGRLTKR